LGALANRQRRTARHADSGLCAKTRQGSIQRTCVDAVMLPIAIGENGEAAKWLHAEQQQSKRTDTQGAGR